MRWAYDRPSGLDEALELLGRSGAEAKVLAGGQSLMPLINMRLARPARIIDLNDLGELDYIRVSPEGLHIGALTRHATIERSDAIRELAPMLTAATEQIGYPSVRSRSTMGGSLAHADPSAEYPAVAVALEAEIVVASATMERRIIPSRRFFRDLMSTDLREDELIIEVRIPLQPRSVGWAFEELALRPGDYAVAGVGVTLELDDGRCRAARIACFSAGPTPIRATDAEAWLGGRRADADAFDEAGRIAAEGTQPSNDSVGSAAFKRRVMAVVAARALARAADRAMAYL